MWTGIGRIIFIMLVIKSKLNISLQSASAYIIIDKTRDTLTQISQNLTKW